MHTTYFAHHAQNLHTHARPLLHTARVSTLNAHLMPLRSRTDGICCRAADAVLETLRRQIDRADCSEALPADGDPAKEPF